jgi:hypothetical protein
MVLGRRLNETKRVEDSDEWSGDRPGLGGTNVLIVTEATTFFAGKFSCDITNTEDLIVEEVTNVEVESDRHESRIKFVDQGVVGEQFAYVECGGEESVAIRDVEGAAVELDS